MKRISLSIVVVASAIGLTSSLAGAAPLPIQRTAPVPYAPGSVYVYSSSSGHKIGTLTGHGLTTRLITVTGEVSG
jgi:hypothetical protein